MSKVKITIGLLIGLLGYILLAKCGFAEWVIGIQTIYAVSPTATPSANLTPTPTTNSKISDLKERIASRVAQLNLVERRGLLGTIASISATRISLVDLQNRTRLVEIDELTGSPKIKDKANQGSGFSSGETISAVGLYNKNSRILLARFIDDAKIYPRIIGEVTAIDKQKFSISISDAGKPTTVDVQSSTQTSAFQEGAIAKSGFSKIVIGEKVFVVAVTQDTPSDSPHYTALRLIMFPDLLPKPPTPTTGPASSPPSQNGNKK